MALNIKNAETYRLAQALADETGETLTKAVSVAVRERLASLQRKGRRKEVLRTGDWSARRPSSKRQRSCWRERVGRA
jgi:hypothetical protein